MQVVLVLGEQPAWMQILLALAFCSPNPKPSTATHCATDRARVTALKILMRVNAETDLNAARSARLLRRRQPYVAAWIRRAALVEAHPVCRRDSYGRVIARIEIDGVDLGKRLIARGLVQPWRGRKANFC